VFALLPAEGLAKPWQGIEPGNSSSLDVFSKFGEPSRKVTVKGKELLVYQRDQAIAGTTQAQFKVDPATHVVERIDVYPAPVIDAEAIEKSYGPACTGKRDEEPCFYKRPIEGKKPYYLYPGLGLAIFFKDDGDTVQSFAFLPPQK
jgi:hypothetical protein